MTDNENEKPRVEVVEENQETLEVVDMDRTPRPEKMAREAAMLDGAHEVRYHERDFLPRRKESLDDVRVAVDALEVKPTSFPEVTPPPPIEPIVEPEPAPPQLPEALRAALEPVVSGKLVEAEVLHKEQGGDLVEAAWEEEGKTTRGLFAVRDGQAQPFDDIAARIDALPVPPAAHEPPQLPGEERAPEAEAGVEAEARPSPETEPERQAAPAKKGLLGRFGGKKKEKSSAPKATEPAAPAPDAEPEAKPAKKRFGLRRK